VCPTERTQGRILSMYGETGRATTRTTLTRCDFRSARESVRTSPADPKCLVKSGNYVQLPVCPGCQNHKGPHSLGSPGVGSRFREKAHFAGSTALFQVASESVHEIDLILKHGNPSSYRHPKDRSVGASESLTACSPRSNTLSALQLAIDMWITPAETTRSGSSSVTAFCYRWARKELIPKESQGTQ
jgi:hypothetical protein